ncbi:MAG: DEAD/DEAH box helicase [Thermoleophilia bacterium]
MHLSTTTFADLGVAPRLCASLATRGFEHPFPVQELVLPHALDGADLQVKAPTGSGKTLAFGLPLVQGIPGTPDGPRALVLAPTRELATQIAAELGPLAAAGGLRTAVIVGGVDLVRQSKGARGAQVIIATPGRLNDLLRRRLIDLREVDLLVLDEADRMLDMGFLPQVNEVVAKLPQDRQTMLFSATLGPQVRDLADRLTEDPMRLEAPGDPRDSAPIAERLDQSFVACSHAERTDTLMDFLRGEEDLAIVFCRTKRGAARLAEKLTKAGLPSGSLHGDLTQRQRERALKAFAQGRTRVLTATDVASRGIDLDGLGLVVNFDPPDDHDTYTHRVGRTARAGRSGRAVTLVTPDQAADVGRIAQRLGLDEHWASTGYAASGPRNVYRSRGRRGPAARPAAAARPRPPATPGTNRVRRGSRTV